MRYFEQERQDWIAETLRVFGFINRVHLMRKFGLSMPQASKDLSTYQLHNTGKIFYDSSKKTYLAGWVVGKVTKPFDSPVDDIFDAFEKKRKKNDRSI
jgi:hypothetical protein